MSFLPRSSTGLRNGTLASKEVVFGEDRQTKDGSLVRYGNDEQENFQGSTELQVSTKTGSQESGTVGLRRTRSGP